MENPLKGKTAVVTGGNIGIGRAISLALAKWGSDVAITFFDDDCCTAEEIRAMGKKCPYVHLDATNSAETNQAFASLSQELGGHIDILVNNAGHLVGRVPVCEMTDDFWHKVIEVNMTSAFYCSRAVIPYMKTGWGRIVNMSSLAGHDGGGAGAVAYSAAKAGVVAFCKSIAHELGRDNIMANVISPGPIHTSLLDSVPKDFLQKKYGDLPVGHFGTVEDIASAAVFLAREGNTYITGQTLLVNGGHFML